MEITKTSDLSGKIHTLNVQVDPEKYLDWVNLGPKAPLIQDAFPELDADSREFLISGITPEEWDGMFGEEEYLHEEDC